MCLSLLLSGRDSPRPSGVLGSNLPPLIISNRNSQACPWCCSPGHDWTLAEGSVQTEGAPGWALGCSGRLVTGCGSQAAAQGG